jgi:hypothetical protein
LDPDISSFTQIGNFLLSDFTTTVQHSEGINDSYFPVHENKIIEETFCAFLAPVARDSTFLASEPSLCGSEYSTCGFPLENFEN